MTDIVPVPNWGGVRQLETNEYATGGLNGNMNEQAKSLAGQNMYSRLFAGLPFDPVFTAQVGGFPIGGRAALENGDIVRSTVANNTVDPNVDMMDWVYANSKSVVSIAEMLLVNPKYNGLVISVHDTGLSYKYDSTQASINNGGTILNGWVAQNLKYVTPEMFGADPTGMTSSRLAIKKMIDSLTIGGVIECKPNAVYYNDAPSGAVDNWLINKDNIYIIAHGATFKRRPTAISTASIDSNLAALQVNGKNCTIEGKVRFSGSEAYADIINASGVSIAVGEYVRGYKSSHGLYLYKADGFTALDVDSRDAVFNIFADRSKNIRIKGYCKSSGQVYPLASSDLQLGSGIKAAFCEGSDIDLITDFAGYAGCEIEPECKYGSVKSIARNPAFFGTIFHAKCESMTVNSIAENPINGSTLRIGYGCKQITGTFNATGGKFGLSIEPSATDATDFGDVTGCDIRGVSKNTREQSVIIVDNASGGKFRESTVHVRSSNDGSGTKPAFTIVNSTNCSFNLGVKTAKQALIVNKVFESEIHVVYMEGIIDASPMYFTANNTVDLTCKIGTVSYTLKRTNGHVSASSLTPSVAAIPVTSYTTFDIRCLNLVVPNLQKTSSSAVSNALWVDEANANAIKRK